MHREGDRGGQKQVGRILLKLGKDDIDIRYIMDGVINKAKEPFSIRKKDFWDVADAYKLLRPEFTVWCQ